MTRALNVDGYVDKAIQEQLSSEVRDAAKDSKNNASSMVGAEKAFAGAKQYLVKVIKNDSKMLQDTNAHIKQIKSSINQLGVVRSFFSQSRRAMREALRDSMTAEEGISDNYNHHMACAQKSYHMIQGVMAGMKDYNKDSQFQANKYIKMLSHINNGLHK